jgi:hypothetical protein
MNSTSFLPITKEAIQTMYTGAIGAMTFGAYSQFQSDKIISLNNQIQETKMKQMLDDREKKFNEMLINSRKWF